MDNIIMRGSHSLKILNIVLSVMISRYRLLTVSSKKALTMYNNSYVNHQFGLKINVQLKKWFTTTLEVAFHGIINNMEYSGGDSSLRHGCECIHRVVTQNWVAQLRLFGSRSQSVDRAVELVNNNLWDDSLGNLGIMTCFHATYY